MIIQDYNSTWDVTKPADIEAALSKRHGAGVNSFWLGYVAGGFPAINILVKGDIAQVHYFPNEDHPGFSSVGNLPGLRPGGFTEFFPKASKETFDIMNETIVSFSEALQAAQEFAVSKTIPKCIQWNSLVEGE